MNTGTTPGVRPPVTPAVERAEPQLRPLPLRTNFAWTLGGFIVYGVCNFAWVNVLAKTESKEMVGRLGLALAVTAPIVMFTRLQLRSIQATDARSEYRFSDYLSLRTASTVASLAIIAVVGLLGARFAHYSWDDVMAILAMGLARASEGFSEVIYGLLQKWERLDLQARSLMIKGPASVIALAVMLHFTHNLAWGALGIAFVWTLLMLLYDVRNARRVMRFQNIEEDLSLRSLRSGRLPVVRQLTWLALPLGFVALLDSLNTNVPRLVIQGHMGNAELGLFTAMSTIGIAGNMVVAALATSASPRLSRDYVGDLPRFRRLVWRLAQFGVVLGGSAVLLAAVLGRPLLTVLYRPEYAEHLDVFIWLLAAAGLGYVARFLVYSMTAARFLRAQAPLYALSLGVLAALSFGLVPTHGLMGAAWAALGGSSVLLLGAIAVNVFAIRSRRSAIGAEQPQPDLSQDWG